jgi:hypothetical protein
MKLQNRYANFEEWEAYARVYNLAKRLGYASAKTAWKANPLIESSVHPSDYRVVKKKR